MRIGSIRALLFTAVVVAASLALVQPAHACSCAGDPFEVLDEEDVEVAFVGTVGSRWGFFGFIDVTWTFDVEEVLVGELGPVAKLTAPAGSGACGLSLEEGERAAVLGYLEDGEHRTDACLVASPASAEGFGDPRPPDPEVRVESGVPHPIGWIVLIAMTLAIGWAALVIQHRRQDQIEELPG